MYKLNFVLSILYTFLMISESHSSSNNDIISSECHSSEIYINEMLRGHNKMIETSHEFNVITKTILLNQSNIDNTRNEVRKYFMDTFDLHTTLYYNIMDEYVWYRAEPLRHPVLWYAAHTAVFYVNKLRVSSIIDGGLNRHYESTFAVGVDEMSWDDKLEDRDDWPLRSDVFRYRNKTRELVLDIIDRSELTLPIKWESPFWVLLMGIEHERIHLETSSVIIRQFPIHMLKPTGIWLNECQMGILDDTLEYKPNLGAPNHSPMNELLHVDGKHVTYGRDVDDMNTVLPVYGWDNEFGEQEVDVPSFNASKYLVSNEEYYEFVLDNGYTTQEYWTEEGWNWVISTKAKHPKFWIKNNKGGWNLRNMLTIIPMAWNWPVITNHLESLAFCNWKSKKSDKNIRLLTEDEWHVLRSTDIDINGKFNAYWEHNANINLHYFASESPVDMFEFSNSSFYDVIGNVWQHTITPQYPFSGFQVHPYYDDFTVPCFGFDHSIIKGGSWISTGNEATYTSRYQFRRHFFQHAGIRYVETDRDTKYLDDIIQKNIVYSDQETVDMYTHFHYGKENLFNIENYPRQVALNAIESYFVYGDNSKKYIKALDLGCAVGRTTFELAKMFDHVIGIDITARLISVAYHMQELGQLDWVIPKEGDIKDHFSVTANELGISHVLNKTFFVQNDALNLDAQYTGFDLIVASNLIDRVNNPRALLTEVLHTRLNVNGILLLCDPYTWLESFTNKNKWLGGYYKNDNKLEPVYTTDVIKELLSVNFNLKDEYDVPMVFRETVRKHQYVVTQCMVWQKKP